MTRPKATASEPAAVTDQQLRDHLSAARLRMSTDYPYYAHGLFALQPVITLGLGTLAVDRRWRLYIDPATATGWDVAELGAILIHELHHLLRDHATLADGLGVQDSERQIWNIAADCAINDDLLEEKMRLPGTPATPRRIGQPDHQLEAVYYDALRRSGSRTVATSRGVASGFGPSTRSSDRAQIRITDGPGMPSSTNAPGGRPDDAATGCGSGADGAPRSWELSPEGGTNEAPGLSEVDALLVRRQVATDVLAHQKARGVLPAGLVRWAQDHIEPTLSWRQLLRSEVRSARVWAAGNTHTTYTRADRRADSRPGFVFPGLQQPMPEVAVVIDTSASMSSTDLGHAIAELRRLLAQTSTRQLWMLACDAQASIPKRVARLEDAELVGGGGTDMCVGIDAVKDLCPRPDIIVVFTDGHTPWPSAAPRGVRIIAVVIGDEAPLPVGQGFSAIRVPSGADA